MPQPQRAQCGCRGPVEPASWNRVESARLNFPPHKPPSNQRLRLACQVRCLGDLEVEKFDEFWGQGATKLPELQPGEGSWSLGAAEFVLDRDAWRSREGSEDQAQL